ncbi:MAG TPA: DNA mismatch repair protein MutS [Thermoanaerobaculia bacterium]|nr:DNA mismatch repair protein MutS [Thermoanaerobaculia bacterium]
MRAYYDRHQTRTAEINRLQALEKKISLARLLAIAVAILAATASLGGVAALAVALFFTLVFVHSRIVVRRERAERGARFYAAGIERIEGTWIGKGNSGERFRDDHHPYASDFDLFGPGSLFELVCRAATRSGEAKLAGWMTLPSHDAAEIAARQEAVAELRDELDFREQMAVVAGDSGQGLEETRVAEWTARPPIEFRWWERALALLLPALTVTAIFLAARPLLLLGPSLAPPWVVLIAVGLQMALGRHLAPRAGAIVSGVERAEPALGQLARILRVAEKRAFRTTRLVSIRDRIGAAAVQEIERLQRLVSLLDARRNQLFAPIALLLMWSSNLAALIERWRRRNGTAMQAWIDAVAELEALSSLASFAAENPSFAMPVLAAGPARFDAVGLGHPLIPADRRVTNDLRLGPELRLLIISGSNMSGKSTFLRSTGVAAVLAFAGGPVCATSLQITPMNVGASIRITDSLQEGSSRFYAEIVRIRQILDLARGGTPLLFLLDEILHGTNSHDRRIGAGAVIRRLVDSGAMGLVSTHDLALAEIAGALGPHAANVHFEDHIEEGTMVFDYRMREGVVKKSNALELMRSVGIEV